MEASSSRVLALIALALLFRFSYGITEPSQCGTCCNIDVQLQPSVKAAYRGLSYLQQQMAHIHNNYGRFLEDRAAEFGADITASDLAAVLSVESSGYGYIDDRMVVRFENHVFFDHYTQSGRNREALRRFDMHFSFQRHGKRWLDHKFRAGTAGSWTPMHTGSQDVEWSALRYAQEWDDTAALKSISMGLPQVMGFNHQSLGYSSPQEMFQQLSASIVNQLRAFFAFIDNHEECLAGLQKRDFVRFARCYNGQGQEGDYGKKMSDAREAYEHVLATLESQSGPDTCKAPAGEGICIEDCTCRQLGGQPRRGLCPGPSSVRCCPGVTVEQLNQLRNPEPSGQQGIQQGTQQETRQEEPMTDADSRLGQSFPSGMLYPEYGSPSSDLASGQTQTPQEQSLSEKLANSKPVHALRNLITRIMH